MDRVLFSLNSTSQLFTQCEIFVSQCSESLQLPRVGLR